MERVGTIGLNIAKLPEVGRCIGDRSLSMATPHIEVGGVWRY